MNEQVTETIRLTAETTGGQMVDSRVDFTARGRSEMPLMILADTAPGTAVSQEFALATRAPDDARHWNWWPLENVAGSRVAASGFRHGVTDPDDGLVLRFVPFYLEGVYFIPDGLAGAPRTYGDVEAFISRHIRLQIYESEQEPLIHRYYAITQARDPDGTPRFIQMPDSRDRMPVLELRLREDAPSYPSSAVLTLFGAEPAGHPRGVPLTLQLALRIEDENDRPPVFTSGDMADPVGEDVTPGAAAATRGDGTVIYRAEATPDVRNDTVAWRLKRDADDDSAMFGIDAASGAVWFVDAPDYEARTTYSFTVVASVGDQAAERQVTIAVTDVNDTPLTWRLPGDVRVVEGVRDTGLDVDTARGTDLAGREPRYEMSTAMADLRDRSGRAAEPAPRRTMMAGRPAMTSCSGPSRPGRDGRPPAGHAERGRR